MGFVNTGSCKVETGRRVDDRMNGVSFIWYCVVGALFAALGTLVSQCTFLGPARFIDSDDPYVKYIAAQSEYEKRLDAYESWHDDNEEALRRHRFEKVIAGIASPDIIQDPDVRFMAETILTLKSRESTPIDIANALMAGLNDVNHRRRLSSEIGCYNGKCTFRKHLSVMNEPERFRKLMSGDADAVDAVDAGSEPSHPGEPPAVVEEPPVPLWASAIRWCVFSVFFALGFTIVGYILHDERKGWSHPLASLPRFLFGWMVILAALPGFLILHTIRLCSMEFDPALEWLKRNLSRKTFKDDLERFEHQLNMVRERVQHEDSGKVQEIEELLQRVKHAKDDARLKELNSYLKTIEKKLDARDEVEEIKKKLDRETGIWY